MSHETPSELDLGPSILFVPADRPDRFQKALDRSDTIVVDMEDAVAPQDKSRARQVVADSRLDPSRTIVRINGARTEWFEEDLRMLQATDYRMLMLPKVEGPEEVARLDAFEVIGVCETPRGVHRAAEIAAAPNLLALIPGVEDLVAALGGSSTQWPSTEYRDIAKHARSAVLIAARALEKQAIDTVYLDIQDIAGQAREASDAAASGFMASCCIHPSQVSSIRTAYRPTDEEVAWARGVLDASVGASGVYAYQGKMVDAPVLGQARSILNRNTRLARTAATAAGVD